LCPVESAASSTGGNYRIGVPERGIARSRSGADVQEAFSCNAVTKGGINVCGRTEAQAAEFSVREAFRASRCVIAAPGFKGAASQPRRPFFICRVALCPELTMQPEESAARQTSTRGTYGWRSRPTPRTTVRKPEGARHLTDKADARASTALNRSRGRRRGTRCSSRSAASRERVPRRAFRPRWAPRCTQRERARGCR
jgi:hypothetical protein